MEKDDEAARLGQKGTLAPATLEPASSLDLEEQLRWLRETIPGCSYRCLLDPASTMLRLTGGIEELTGFPADEFILNRVRTFASMVHPDDREEVSRIMRSAVQSDAPYYLEYRLLHRDGSVRWVSERGRATVSDGEVRWLDGQIVDQTDVRSLRDRDEQRKDAVRRQQAALVSLVTSDAVASGDITEASKIATELVAEAANTERASVWILHEPEGSLCLVNLFHRSEDSHSAGVSLESAKYPSYFDAMQTGRLIDANDAQNDPRTREFRDSYLVPLGITSLLDVALRVSGRVVGILCLEHIGDVRTWSDHEVQFAGEVAAQLAHALLNQERKRAQQREAELQEQLFFSQKMEAIGQLAGSVAHDFNNLLTVISGFAEELQQNLTEPSALDDVTEIVKAARQGTDLTAQLLSMSRRAPIELEPVDLAEAVQTLSKMLPKMLSDDVTLTLSVPTHPVPVRASLGLAQQIMTNLIVNAGHALDERGTISVAIRTSEEASSFAVERAELPKGRYALLEVADSGRGMSEEVRLRIFEPFFTTRPHGTGTGLGLSTVYDILQRCGGGIRVSSTPGEGSTFTAYLPLLEEDAPVLHLLGTPKDDAGWAKGLHFVVVEDNVAVLGVMQNALGRLGAQITTATRPDEAIEILKNWPDQEASGPDLVLTDMGMPGGGGSKVIRWMKEHRPHIPVGIVSGYIADNQAEAVEGLEVLRKPFLSGELQNFARVVLLGD